jgi:DNA-binding phage protein
MSRRSRDWNEDLARDLRDPEFAREFLKALLDEGFTLQEALARTVRACGVKEFAKRARMPSPNVLRSISPHHNPTQKTIEQLLRPFGLRLTVEASATGRKRRRVA